MRTTNRPTPGGSSPRPLTVRYRMVVLLLTMAVLPLTGVAWFALGEVRIASSDTARAEAVDASVNRLVLLSGTRSRLQDERNWSAASVALEQFGIGRNVGLAFSGFDIPAEAAASAGEVDLLLAELELDGLAADLAAVRAAQASAGDLEDVSRAYDPILAELEARRERTLDELLFAVSGLEGGPELSRSLRVVEASALSQGAVARESNVLLASQAGTDGLTGDLATLLVKNAIRTEAEGEIRRLVGMHSEAREVMGLLDESPDADVFDAAVTSLIERRLVPVGDGAGPTSATAVDLGRLALLFQASGVTADLYFDLVDAAGADAQEASAAVRVSAERRLDRAVLLATGLMAVSLLFALAASRAVVRPVQRLAEVARRISDGDSSARFGRASGSIEIREAGRAMDTAAAHLQVAEQQAKALADGDLDHPVLSRTSTGQLGASLQEAVEALASSLQEREEFRRRMTHEATHDGLTQIANRNASLAHLRRSLARVGRAEARLALLFIDLDGFKEINDTQGHQAGDTVLRTTAQRLVNNVRDGDHVGRLGGDEFIVIAEPISDINEAVELSERLLAALAEPVAIDHGTVLVNASIGIALSDGTAEVDSVDLLRDADMAVYKAKGEGRGRVEICDDDLRSVVYERADLERALRRAIDEMEFVLHYQPIREPVSGTLRGFEALVRWNRPGHGMVGPDVFIPLAERGDLIVAIDQWVVGAAVRQLVAWEAEGLFSGLPVSVNVSGRHLASPSLIDDILSPLRDHGVDPSLLIVELTESALLEDLESAAAKLHVLRDHGIRIAIDDFGTGYTSLAHLRSLPVDILKIDRSYTTDESAASLVKLIIDTGHLLGATVTAEGIETPLQAAQLAEMGTDEVQGYYYGRPQPPSELVDPASGSTVGSVGHRRV